MFTFFSGLNTTEIFKLDRNSDGVPSVFLNEPGPMNVSPFSSFIVRSKIGDCKTLFGNDKIGQWYPE